MSDYLVPLVKVFFLMHPRKNLIIASVGTAFQYYDFVIYALMAPYISKIFFPSSEHYTALVETFMIFAAGYVSRLFGGIVLGMLGDKIGRKKVFMASVFIMAISTLSIGIIPTCATWSLAPIILLALRLVQGFCFGSHMPGAVTLVSEHAKKQSHAVSCGVLVSSLSLGIGFGAFVVYLLTVFLSEQSIQAWGWRIPFIFGGLFTIIVFLFRFYSEETPQFLQAPHVKNSFVELILYHKKRLLIGISTILFPANFAVFFLAMPSCFQEMFHYSFQQTYLATITGYLWGAILLPIFGHLSNRTGRKALLLTGMILFAAIGLPMFSMLKHQSIALLILFVLAYQTIIAIMSASYFAMLSSIFPTEVRFTGVALCYNLAVMPASFMPAISNYLYKFSHESTPMVFILLIFAGISALTILLSKNISNQMP